MSIDRGWQRLRCPKGPRTQITHLDLNTLSYLQSILDLDTKVPHSARHICVSQQQLDGSKILGLLVDQCHLGPSDLDSWISAAMSAQPEGIRWMRNLRLHSVFGRQRALSGTECAHDWTLFQSGLPPRPGGGTVEAPTKALSPGSLINTQPPKLITSDNTETPGDSHSLRPIARIQLGINIP